ncbi:zinc-ribbon domain containing protein [Roseateles sp. SL47]|uniref:zinc-ribbon domain containing protein n=1 Tax=Roseateles sp. SL47 TaxID=2995138 RepID=UPI0022707460|nr:zinc-ribbon domain containing protein [Roseateles sp. SL47]WAC75523.1 zinc-ribbon domain containing protein [Roseateles sp. SL47]
MPRSCRNCRLPTDSLLGRFIGSWTGGLCLRCAAQWRHSAKDAPVLADTSLWSEASKRSRSYEPGTATHYFDEFYWCSHCRKPAVFTALQQKHAYEVEKRYLFQTRKLCDPCHQSMTSRRNIQH